MKKKPSSLERRTWWNTARQILGVLLLVFVSIVFFRIFGPERKQPTITDLFRPDNSDIEFLDALEQVESYYERMSKKDSANTVNPGGEIFEESLAPQPALRTNAVYYDNTVDNSTLQKSDSMPASREALP